MDKRKNNHFGISWIFGGIFFVVIITAMFLDIMSREGVFRQNNNYLVIGTNAGFKPFEYQENGNVVGFDIDMSREIAKKLGKELKVSDMSFDGLLPALESRQIDMAVAGMSVTPEREKNALFSAPYFSAAQKIIVRKGSRIRNKFQLAGEHIGVQLGTTGDNVARGISGSKISQFPNAPSVLQELSSGGIEAVILDEAPASQYVVNFPDLEILSSPLTSENYAIAMKKGNEELKNKVDEEIKQMKKDGRYKNLVIKYFGEDYYRNINTEEDSTELK